MIGKKHGKLIVRSCLFMIPPGIVGFYFRVKKKKKSLFFFNIENESNENFLREGRIHIHSF